MKPIFKVGDIITHKKDKYKDIYEVLEIIHKDGIFGKYTRKYLHYNLCKVELNNEGIYVKKYVIPDYMDVHKLGMSNQDKFKILRRDNQEKIKKKKLKI